MKDPDNFITGAAVGALAVLMASFLPPLHDERRECIFTAKSIDCVQVWAPIGEAKQ